MLVNAVKPLPKYPLYYTWAEQQGRIEIDAIEAEEYAAIDWGAILAEEYESELKKREHFLLEELLSSSYPYEKESVGNATGVVPSDIKVSKFGDKYVWTDSHRIYIKVIKANYEIYALTFKMANGDSDFILFGE